MPKTFQDALDDLITEYIENHGTAMGDIIGDLSATSLALEDTTEDDPQ